MQIKKKANKKVIIIAIIAVLLITGGTAAAIVVHNNQQAKESSQQKDKDKKETKSKDDKSDKKNQESSSSDDKKSDDGITTIPGENGLPTTDGKTPARYEGGSAQNSATLTGTINGASVANGNLSIRVTINQLVNDANGTCSLNLAGPSGQTYAEQAKLIDDPQTSTCYGWDIPTSKIGFTNGKWIITVHLNGGGKTGTLTKEVNL